MMFYQGSKKNRVKDQDWKVAFTLHLLGTGTTFNTRLRYRARDHRNYYTSWRDASINVKPEGGTPGICGAFDFSQEFLVIIPTVGPKYLVKSDQISPTWGSNIP